MENQFVPYELAVKLKELGFNEDCLGSFDISKNLYSGNSTYTSSILIKAPLWQQAFYWFRSKGFDSCVDAVRYIGYEEIGYFTFKIKGSSLQRGYKFKTYEEAREQCLIKLIELCKEK